jgi:hypothetical protein
VKLGPIDPGPVDLATGASFPEITAVERLTLRPGDALVIRIPVPISQQQLNWIIEVVRVRLKLDEAIPVLVLDSGASAEVIETPGEITR